MESANQTLRILFRTKSYCEKGKTPTVDQMNINIRSFPLAQIGRSSRTVTEDEPNCEPQQDVVIRDSVAEEGSKKLDPCLNLHNPETKKSTSPEAQEAIDCSITDVEYRIPLIKKCGSLRGKRCEIVMKTLEELQDNGQFRIHEFIACKLVDFYRKAKNSDMEASLMIERGVQFYYAGELKKSKKLFRTALGMGESLQNRNLLLGRACVMLGATYRYERKFGKAFQYLKQAAELLSNHEPGEDTSYVFYYYGVNWLDLHWSSFSDAKKGRQIFKTKARESLDISIANIARDERPRVQLKRKRYFNLRLAAYHLECGTRTARETRHVTNEDIKKAKNHLDVVEYQLSDGLSLGTEIQLLKTRSDQYYREGKFAMAKETAQHALGIAERANMGLEIFPLNERIEESTKILALSSPDVSKLLSDSGCSADGSNSS